MSKVIDITRTFNLRYHLAIRAVKDVIAKKKYPNGKFHENFCPVCYAKEAIEPLLSVDARIDDTTWEWEILGRRAAWGEVIREYSHTCEKKKGD